MIFERKSEMWGGGIPPLPSRKGHKSPIVYISAVFAVIIMLSVVFMPAISEDSNATSSDSWVCTIALDGTSLTTKYSINGGELTDATAVKGFGDGKTEGSWRYDEQTGYGPFGSFYAAFDPNNSNEMVCHLNPYNLKEAVGGGTSVVFDGKTVNISECNIMWCLPKVYLSVTSSGTGVGTMIMASDESYGGVLAPAFTVGGKDYNYLALGVYEATSDGTKLGSVSGLIPQYDTSLAQFRTEAKNNSMVEGSLSQLWNFHQYQLYRLCSLAVMENFDSQAQVGYGNAFNSDFYGYSQTGSMDSEGPYFGTSDHNVDGAKLFVENAWGSLSEFIDDACWQNGLYAGQNINPSFALYQDNTLDKDLVYSKLLNGPGTSPYSTDILSWGFPEAVGDSCSTVAPDCINSSVTSYAAILVGGSRNDGEAAGLTYLMDDDGGGYYYRSGARLAFLFTTDSMARLSVRYVDDETLLRSDSVQKEQPYAISDLIPEKENFTFGGWSYGDKIYDPGEELPIGDSDITLTAIWISSIAPVPVIPIIPDTVEPEEQGAVVPIVVEEEHGFWLQKNGKSILIFAIIAAIIAELAVLTVSRDR